MLRTAANKTGKMGDFLEGVQMFYPTDAQFGTVKAAAVPNGGKFMALVGTRFETQHDADGNEIAGGKLYLYRPSASSRADPGSWVPSWATR